MLQAFNSYSCKSATSWLRNKDLSRSTWNRWGENGASLSGKIYDSKGLKVQIEWKSLSPFILFLTAE